MSVLKGVSVLRGFLSPRINQTVHNNKVSVLSWCLLTVRELIPCGRKSGLKPWAWRIELGQGAEHTLWHLFLKKKMPFHNDLILDWWFSMCFVRNSLLTLCCATTLHKTTEALPHFLSPYLVDLLIQVGTLFSFHSPFRKSLLTYWS